MMNKSYFPLIAVFAIYAQGSMASTRHPVKVLSGYNCAMLNLTHEEEMDFNHPPMMRAEPRDDARDIGGAGTILAIKANVAPVNGYLPALQMNMQPGWIKQTIVKPYAASADPTAQCVPVLMSDGTQGFTFHHH